MWGADDPDCRKPMVWQELTYEPETSDPLGRPRTTDSVKFDASLFNWYKKLISIRKENQTLSLGNTKFFLIDNDNKIIGYSRILGSETIFVVINNKDKSDEISVNFKTRNKELTNLVDESTITGENQLYKIKLKPYGLVILK